MPKQPVPLSALEEAAAPTPTILHAAHPANKAHTAIGRVPMAARAHVGQALVGQIIAAGAVGFFLGWLCRRA